MALVAGVDSSTQSTKVVVRDAETGRLQRTGSAPHPDGTEVDPKVWWDALNTALAGAGGLADVECLSIGAQQHGLVCLDAAGDVIRPALLWNDTRSALAATDLVVELGEGDAAEGAWRWAQAVGSVPVASFTITKLRWLADHEPESAARIAAIALPHDWLTWRLAGARSLEQLSTDRSDASGTGYFNAVTNTYRRDLLALALRREEPSVEHIVLPRVLGPDEPASRVDGSTGGGFPVLAPGSADNAAAALGLGLGPGDTFVSLGTSGVVATVSQRPTADVTGSVAGFADATGHFLPLACTLNGSRILDTTRRVLGIDHEQLSALALDAPAGAGGLVLLPYLDGERTPNLPTATGSLHGITSESMTRENLARAAVEGTLCLLAGCIDAVREQGVQIERVCLVGGGARSRAVREIAPAVFGVPVDVPSPGEYVADGAARQAAWVLSQAPEPPTWRNIKKTTYTSPGPDKDVLDGYRAAAAMVAASLTTHPRPKDQRSGHDAAAAS